MIDPEYQLCRRSCQYFIFDSGRLKTKDEHDAEHPVKVFPVKPYLRVMLDCLLLTAGLIPPAKARYALEAALPVEEWHNAGMLAIEKSRQILATWLIAAYCLWRAKYLAHQLILWQSKKEDDAASVVYDKDPTVARMSFMEYHLPANLQDRIFPAGASRCNLRFPSGSRIWGIPEGADVIRSNTPSVLVADEAAFQPEFASAKDAAMPAVKGGGQLVAVSSAAPGSFAQWVGAEGA